MPVHASVEDVETIPSGSEDAIQLKVAAIRFFIGLQLALGIFVGQVSFVLVECYAIGQVASLEFIGVEVGFVFVVVMVGHVAKSTKSGIDDGNLPPFFVVYLSQPGEACRHDGGFFRAMRLLGFDLLRAKK